MKKSLIYYIMVFLIYFNLISANIYMLYLNDYDRFYTRLCFAVGVAIVFKVLNVGQQELNK